MVNLLGGSRVEAREYWLALTLIKGLGSIRLSKLLQHFGEPSLIWSAEQRLLATVSGIGASLASSIVKQREQVNIVRLQERLCQEGIEYFTITDRQYPEILKNMYDPPPVLFYKGKINFASPAIAIVGSRRSTGYGCNIAGRLAYELAERGVAVVSGLARGIDTCGHLGALKAKGDTIAVLGSGLDQIYPAENRKLFQEIVAKGLVLSEYPPGTEPLPGNFPQRNRIISGLSRGVVVVEASRQSGSLITADLALEQGREIFAVPGNINRPQSQGCNNLIKKGAKMVTAVDDILEELFLDVDFAQPAARVSYPQMSEREEVIIQLLQQEGEMNVDQIIQRSHFTVAQVNSILLKLELKGLVKREAGKKYLFLGLQNLLKPL